jgi:serine/threonine protein kinase
MFVLLACSALSISFLPTSTAMQYMAPGVLANKPYSDKADVYSFGILLWEIIARKLPYFGMQPMQVGIAVMQQGLRPPIPPKCPPPLAKLMITCWDANETVRPSFEEIQRALESTPDL